MRTRTLLPILLAVAISGCATFGGDSAREKALLPALRSAWPGVESDVHRGIKDGVEDGDLTGPASDGLFASSNQLEAALGKDLEEARVVSGIEWPLLHPFALRGVLDRVDDEEISEGVGLSLNERITQFDAAIQALQGR